MPRPNFNNRLPCYRQESPILPHSPTHTGWDPHRENQYNQFVPGPVGRRGMSASLPVHERSMSPQTPPEPHASSSYNASRVPQQPPRDHRLTRYTNSGSQPAGLCQPADKPRAVHEFTPPAGSVAYVDHGRHTSNLLHEIPNPSYHPPRPPAYFTPFVPLPAHRSYQPSPETRNIECSEPVRDRGYNDHPCRWRTDNAPCPYSLSRSRLGIESHLRAYHQVSDDSRPVVCRWEGCARTQPLKRENLARHLLTHVNVKWECPECNKLFARSDAVQRHRRRVCPSRGRDAA
ncbi:hypothetical protein EDD15DRAFT_1298383 [Pisolithus albus]|nr:hypothetical protein EDD15DRAFT_1298383 [Pisolithus albus]